MTVWPFYVVDVKPAKSVRMYQLEHCSLPVRATDFRQLIEGYKIKFSRHKKEIQKNLWKAQLAVQNFVPLIDDKSNIRVGAIFPLVNYRAFGFVLALTEVF